MEALAGCNPVAYGKWFDSTTLHLMPFPNPKPATKFGRKPRPLHQL